MGSFITLIYLRRLRETNISSDLYRWSLNPPYLSISFYYTNLIIAIKAYKGAGGIGAARPGAGGVALPLGPPIVTTGGAIVGGDDGDGVRKKKRGKLSDAYNAAPFTNRRVPCAKCARAFAY